MTPRLLVVDDDADLRMLLRVSMHDDFVIETAPNGPEALRVLGDRPDDFAGVILDLMMPEMSGFEVLEQLRAHPATVELPVVILTAMTDRDARFDTLVGGAHAFVTKPYDADELIATIKDLLRRSRTSRQASRFGQIVDLADD